MIRFLWNWLCFRELYIQAELSIETGVCVLSWLGQRTLEGRKS